MGESSSGARAKLQKFGGVLSGMVMPNIGAFITWGLITAIFLATGWFPNAYIAKLISPMLTYLLPILIGYTGGKNVYGDRGGVIGAAATMGVVVGSDIPMFMGAMIMGPVAAICMRKIDKLLEGKIKPGFEMIVNNYSCGILGILLVLAAYFGIGPFVQALTHVMSSGVSFIIEHGWTPFASVFIEPAKVLFLNNAINHGILGPLGIAQAAEAGKSILFILEPNPGPGVGVLLAYTFFGTGIAKETAPGVAIIHAFGGIHEPYFPFILMKPQMILASIGGALAGNFVFQTFKIGLVSTASPGSYFSVLSVTSKSDYVPVICGMLLSTAVSFAIGSLILKMSKDKDEDSLENAIAQKDQMKTEGGGKVVSSAINRKDLKNKTIRKVYVACDAGMGSSAMGASILKDKMKKAGLTEIEVKNVAIPDLPDDVDIVVTHESLTERARVQCPNAIHRSVDNFLSNQVYDELVESLIHKEDEIEILQKKNILLNQSFHDSKEAIHKIGEILTKDGYVSAEYTKGMLQREKESPTNIGNGIAIPHGTLEVKKEIKHSGIVVMVVPEGVKWNDDTVYLIVGIAGVEQEHLAILSNIALVLNSKEQVDEIVKNQKIEEIYDLFTKK
ncbi:MAG: PTS mannitol transporter subunit IICBA [Anaerostipes sp.]|jgi:PTS system mannitol-specific IIC component